MRRILLAIVAVVVISTAACESAERPADSRLGRAAHLRSGGGADQAAPTSSKNLPDGGLEAIWETEMGRGRGTKQLILTFDENRKLKTWKEQLKR